MGCQQTFHLPDAKAYPPAGLPPPIGHTPGCWRDSGAFYLQSLWGQKQDFPVAKVTPARGPGASVLGTGFQSGFVLSCHLLG